MSDVGAFEAVGEMKVPVPSGEITAGSMMRHAREAAGLHVAALAVSMKIPVKKLEALEADRLDLLHDAVFARALAAGVCRALKIDPIPILSKLPLNAAPKLNPYERGINAPFHSSSNATGISIPALLTKPSALIVVVLVVAGLAIFFLPDIKAPDWFGEQSSVSSKTSDSANHSQMAMPPVDVAATSFEPASAAVGSLHAFNNGNESAALPPATVASSGDATTVKNAVSINQIVDNQPVVAANRPDTAQNRPTAPVIQPVMAASRPSTAPVLPSTGMVVFKAKGSTWVKVVDAKGIVLLSKTMVDGEVVGASGTTPLSVVIGRVDATDVEVRGKPFALMGVSRDNVARFEVK